MKVSHTLNLSCSVPAICFICAITIGAGTGMVPPIVGQLLNKLAVMRGSVDEGINSNVVPEIAQVSLATGL